MTIDLDAIEKRAREAKDLAFHAGEFPSELDAYRDAINGAVTWSVERAVRYANLAVRTDVPELADSTLALVARVRELEHVAQAAALLQSAAAFEDQDMFLDAWKALYEKLRAAGYEVET